MLPLFVVAVVLVLYGTLYPFEIVHTAGFGDIPERFLQSFYQTPGIGDVLSNVVLFLPFGFFGMQALLPRLPRFVRLVMICALGAALSFSIECMQTFIVGRFTSIFDLVLNSGGAFVGACFGWVDWNRRLGAGSKGQRPPSLFPALLVGSWLAYRLFPYVPTIDFQHVKDAIKPVLTGEFTVLDVFRHFVAVLVVGSLLQAILTPPRAARALPVVALGTIFVKPFLMTRVMGLSEIIGATAALVFWFVVLARLSYRTRILLLLLTVQVTVQGLIPFLPTHYPHPFSFVPFHGFEGGSMALNLQSFLEKIFLYGSLIWLAVQCRMKLSVATSAVVVLLTAIELTQTRLDGRVAEITDPLLALILGLALFFFERSARTGIHAIATRN